VNGTKEKDLEFNASVISMTGTNLRNNGSSPRVFVGTDWFGAAVDMFPGKIDDLAIYSAYVSDANILSLSKFGQYDWTVPNDPGSTVKVRVRSSGTPASTDDSDSGFTITSPGYLELIYPNGTDQYQVGRVRNISWDFTQGTAGALTDIILEYSVLGNFSDTVEITNSLTADLDIDPDTISGAQAVWNFNGDADNSAAATSLTKN